MKKFSRELFISYVIWLDVGLQFKGDIRKFMLLYNLEVKCSISDWNLWGLLVQTLVFFFSLCFSPLRLTYYLY
ncbi:hypothetical protein ERO13_A11G089150v2 [Gossypium hirsutum]|uniref:Uncharacterized protein n=1 Tax=Gossypium mustelinum TaxID=34275 RepID=A0A5D2X449_GOSMU|nr:hypothetical protein ERO13_A11G089150v2 [Gossypium hirsutum]TYJ08827.1 hypothetical protein E1A91_A11G098700v1 [Gossypium mustelinum]